MTNEDLNKLSEKIIGIAISIHKKLGPGFVEKIYEKALIYEFEKKKIQYICQETIKVKYHELNLGNQRIDFLIENEIIVEIKSVSSIVNIFEHQLISYLKTADKRLGLILNFGSKKLGIKRLVNKF
jgi:GxxExxY protein